MRHLLFLLFLIAMIVGCSKSNARKTPNNVVSRSTRPLPMRTHQSSYPVTIDAELKVFKDRIEYRKLDTANHVDNIPEMYLKYLKYLDTNFRMASEGEPWQVGCSPPVVKDSSVTYRDPKTGKLVSTLGFRALDAPNKKLEFFGWNEKTGVLIYQSGGFASNTNAIFFTLKNGYIEQHWLGYIRAKIQSEDDILDAIDKGLINKKDPRHYI